MQLYLCRHGETEWSLSGQHTSKTDLPLTEKGRKEALLLKKRLLDVPFEKIFTSPSKRARETCEGMGALQDPNLEEWDYGEYEGWTSEEIHQKNKSWNLFVDGAPGGESPKEVAVRADLFLKSISQYKARVAVFSHGHFLRVLAARFLGLNPEMGNVFLVSVGSVSILGYDRGQPVIMLWNDIGHL